ncbi:MAG: hypothetical protein ACREOO_21750 [bacterium]
MKRILLIIGVALLISGSVGCGSYTSLHRPSQSSPDANAMTVNDVAVLSKAGVGDSVIIAQIQATQSLFALSSQEIINLKNAGVSETVIGAMIKTTDRPNKRDSNYVYVPYPYYGRSRGYLGISLYGGHYSGGHLGGHHLGGGHHFGGHGISRGHSGHAGRPRSFGRR